MNYDNLVNFFNRAVHPLKTMVNLMTGKAIIKLVDDTKGIQHVQISALAGESMDKVPRFQNFGFTSNPPVDSEAVIVALGGQRENVIVVTADNRVVRFKNLASGESAVYTDDGTVIHLKKGGTVDVLAATKVMITVPDVEITGNLKVGGNLTVVGNSSIGGNESITGNLTVGGTGTITGVISGGANAAITGVVGAAGYTGPAGAPMAMTVDLVTTGNVSGGGTSLSAIKTKFNSHTHPENGQGGGTTSPPSQTL